MARLWERTAAEIAASVRAGEVSAAEVLRAHLERLDAVNPRINAIVADCRDEARRAAEAIDRAVARGGDPGPLAGVPVTIKVNVDQAGWASTNGLKLLKDAVARQDSPVVSKLRRAGAIIVGRTNTPAFSLRWFTRNDLHGETLNPRDPALTPGGSSGGAAAAVAAGMCAIGHGTDIAGSIRYPAHACGLHGLRPTPGRIPAWNASAPDRFIGAQIMVASGPIARSVEDVEIAFRAMAGMDPRDPWSVPAPFDSGPFERRAALAVAPEGMAVAPPVAETVRAAARVLEDAGWTVEETELPPVRAAAAVNATLWMAEMDFGAREMIEREGEADSRFVFREMCRHAGPLDLDAVMRALQKRLTLAREWALFTERYPLVICPVSGMPPFDRQQDVRSPEAFAEVLEAQLLQRALPATGLPCMSVATGTAAGRPAGVQLVAGRFREDVLIAAARDLEAALGRPEVAGI